MKNQRRDALHDLLRQWAQRHTPAEADADRLRRRVTQALRDEAFLDLPPPAARSRRRAWGWALGFALGTAAAVAVMVALRAGDGPRSDVPQSAFFAQSELAEKAKLLAAMQDLFAGRLAWVGEAGREVQLGLLPDAVPGPRPGLDRTRAPLAIRVVVLTRPGSGAAWKPIWQADVIAQDEEVVDLAAQSVRDGTLRLWMHTLPDGAIAVDANLALKGAACVRSSFSGIQRTGVPQRVFDLQTDGAEYQAYQTVAPLEVKESS